MNEMFDPFWSLKEAPIEAARKAWKHKIRHLGGFNQHTGRIAMSNGTWSDLIGTVVSDDRFEYDICLCPYCGRLSEEETPFCRWCGEPVKCREDE